MLKHIDDNHNRLNNLLVFGAFPFKAQETHLLTLSCITSQNAQTHYKIGG